MTVDNRTPFPALAFRQFAPSGEKVGVLVMRATFRLGLDGALDLADDQEPIRLADAYAGEPGASALVAPTDLAPYRPATDITALASAQAPDGHPSARWSCGLALGPVEARLVVTGPRDWQAIDGPLPWSEDPLRRRQRRTWSLGEPEPVSEVPIDWRLAWGGVAEAPGGGVVNPLGRGAWPERASEGQPRTPAPQIEWAGDPIDDPAAPHEPAGLGPMPPSWPSRLRHAGTFGKAWLRDRHPLLPRDFDPAFWNAAPARLQARPWLRGGEAFRLDRLMPGRPVVAGRLPVLRPFIGIAMGPRWVQSWPVLDGVEFDLKARPARLSMVWRGSFPWADLAALPKLRLADEDRSTSRLVA